jgi:hypothetical protein
MAQVLPHSMGLELKIHYFHMEFESGKICINLTENLMCLLLKINNRHTINHHTFQYASFLIEILEKLILIYITTLLDQY